jgi:hypothetical protein
VVPAAPCADNVPVRLPAAVGVTAIVKLPDCPTASAIGVVMPVTLNCELESVTCVISIPTVPVFDTETTCVACLPTTTWPKFTLEGIIWKEPADVVCFAALLVTPAHPVNRVEIDRIDAVSRSVKKI